VAVKKFFIYYEIVANFLQSCKFIDESYNAAERAIRPMVLTRKISGGSKTPNGARIHAVNMSVIETIVKRKLPLLNTLQEYLLKGATGKN